MRFIILSIGLLIGWQFAAAIDSETTWEKYKDIFEKSYPEHEDLRREELYYRNIENMAEHNSRYLHKLESYKKGINQFTDLTTEERLQFSNTRLATQLPQKKSSNLIRLKSDTPVPESFNWVEKGAVTPVKDQKRCGSCYAFGSNVAFEAQYFLQTGTLRSFSEQNLIDCALKNDGCAGGFPSECFEYVLEQGLMFQDDYEYKGNVSGSCAFHEEKRVFPLADYFFVDAGDEETITRIIATVGPVTVTLDDRYFHDYAGGVLDEASDCSESNHVVGLVGYGRDADTGKEYFLAKNSWGDWWGEDGYIRLARNVNYCFLADYAVAPLL